MTRRLRLSVAQVGGIAPEETREEVVARLVVLLREAAVQGACFVVFPELALTTFFARYWHEDRAEVDRWFEREMPSDATRPLFDAAREEGIGFYLGYAELTGSGRRFNTAVVVDRLGEIVGKYRKIHVPGHVEPRADVEHQHLEKRYFEVGDLGWGVFDVDGARTGIGLCNDRRWPEVYRMWALQSAEIGIFGFNTPTGSAVGLEAPHLPMHHHLLALQAGAYQNSLWIVAAAKCGIEDGQRLMNGSVVISPSGEIVARALSEDDEVVTADLDLEAGNRYRNVIFDFERNRQPQTYGLITSRLDRGEPLRIPHELW